MIIQLGKATEETKQIAPFNVKDNLNVFGRPAV